MSKPIAFYQDILVRLYLVTLVKFFRLNYIDLICKVKGLVRLVRLDKLCELDQVSYDRYVRLIKAG